MTRNDEALPAGLPLSRIHDDVRLAVLSLDDKWAHQQIIISPSSPHHCILTFRVTYSSDSAFHPGEKGTATATQPFTALHSRADGSPANYALWSEYEAIQVGVEVPYSNHPPPWPYLTADYFEDHAYGLLAPGEHLVWQLRLQIVRHRQSPLTLLWRWHPTGGEPTATIHGLERPHTELDLQRTHKGMEILHLHQRIVPPSRGRPRLTADEARQRIVAAMVATGTYTLVAVAEHWAVDDRAAEYWRERSGRTLPQLQEEARQLREGH